MLTRKSLSFEWLLFAALLVVAQSSTSLAQDLAGVKCVVNGKGQASSDHSVEYLEGNVYFCCENCVAKFKEELKKEENAFAIKANHQLVLTGQYVQKGCPISGGAIKEDAYANVGGAKIGFCCNHCQGKVNDTEELADKAKLVFSKAAFKKGFEAKPAINLEGVKCMMMSDKDVNADYAAEYGGGQVYFCCKGCLKKFNKDPEAYTTLANHQLVATGQVKQLACPISGGELSDEQYTEVAGVKVQYCCEHCKSKVDKANDKKKLEFVFGKKGFAKAYQDE